MGNKEKYDAAFIESFSIEKDDLRDSLEYDSIEAWDSIGHMTLMGVLEDNFDISLDMEDIIDFNSYSKGFTLLEKYGISFD
jgi:acyl carrier protein